MGSNAIDGTPFGAWALLRDGQWHSSAELKQRCGSEGTKRARDLRTPKYGSWNLLRERKLENGVETWFYRICPEEIQEKDLAAAMLDSRSTVCDTKEKADLVDEIKRVKLTVSDIVLLLAMLRNDDKLNNPDVYNLWSERIPALRATLREYLPEGILTPYDLFENED